MNNKTDLFCGVKRDEVAVQSDTNVNKFIEELKLKTCELIVELQTSVDFNNSFLYLMDLCKLHGLSFDVDESGGLPDTDNAYLHSMSWYMVITLTTESCGVHFRKHINYNTVSVSIARLEIDKFFYNNRKSLIIPLFTRCITTYDEYKLFESQIKNHFKHIKFIEMVNEEWFEKIKQVIVFARLDGETLLLNCIYNPAFNTY